MIVLQPLFTWHCIFRITLVFAPRFCLRLSENEFLSPRLLCFDGRSLHCHHYIFLLICLNYQISLFVGLSRTNRITGFCRTSGTPGNEFNSIGHFRVHLSLHFKARLSAKSLLWKSVFINIEIGTSYHNKNFALRLALKERLKRTRKWPIRWPLSEHPTLVALLYCHHSSPFSSPFARWDFNESLCPFVWFAFLPSCNSFIYSRWIQIHYRLLERSSCEPWEKKCVH